MLLRVILLWLAGTSLALAQVQGTAISASLSADRSSAYLNEQILLTLTVRIRKEAFGVSGGHPDIDGASVISLHKREFEENIAGVIYRTTLHSYAAFAERSGQLTVSPVSIQAQLPVSFSEGAEKSNPQISAITDALELRVTPPPASQHVWLPASALTVSHNWLNADKQSVARARQGEPITYSVQIELQGQHPAAIPPLEIAAIDGLRIYPQQSSWSQGKAPTGLGGKLEQTITLVGARAEDLEFPGIRVTWWDINQKKWQTSTTPSETISILPQIAADPAPRDFRLLGWALGLILTSLVLAKGIKIYLSRIEQGARLSERAAWRWVRRCLARRELTTLRTAIQLWSQHLLPHVKSNDVSSIKVKEPALAHVMMAIDHALYSAGSQTNPDWDEIKSKLYGVRERRITPTAASDGLAALYLTD